MQRTGTVTPYPVPASEARSRIEVLNSRFIASAAPASTVAEARAFVARIKGEFPDATHNVPAYLIGHGATVIAHCHDDGEPAGTAGRPALAVLRGSGLGDVVVVVTRYFGGTKLGTGGLVRAYGDAVRSVLKVLPRAIRVPTYTVLMAVPYTFYDRVRLALAEVSGRVLSEEFGALVTVTAQLAVADYPALHGHLQNLSNGTIQLQIIATHEALIPL